MQGRSRWFGPLRPLALAAWNSGHRFVWQAKDYLNAIANRRLEHCDACGRRSWMLYRRRVIPPRLVELWGLSPRLAEALARKESLECASCGAKLRARRLARVILDLFPVGTPPVPAQSLAEWSRNEEARALRVAEINRIDGLHEAIADLPHLTFSDFQEGASPNALVDGVRSEDLTRLTFDDSAFDLVLTSETLEHVPDLNAALQELYRVLAPGGYHVFTVPLLPTTPHTFPRAQLRLDGTIEPLAPLIRHPGGDIGYPVFTEFGADLLEILRHKGFESTIRFGPTTEDDLTQVFVCRKKETNAPL